MQAGDPAHIPLPPPPPGTPCPQQAARHLRLQIPPPPTLAIVLGSGFAGLIDVLTQARTVPYAEIPGFTAPSVPSHAGALHLGLLGGTSVAVLAGRTHFYEGHDLATVTFPIRVLAALGVRALLLTNAAGGIREDLVPGTLVAVTDHLNLMGHHPLRGTPPPHGFVDLTEVYSPRMRAGLHAAAATTGALIREGVYAAVSGPAYETPAEIRALRALGADLVGMSTVPEAIVARACRMEVAALSCITNRAAGLGGRISHDEVLHVGRRIAPLATRLIHAFAASAAGNPHHQPPAPDAA